MYRIGGPARFYVQTASVGALVRLVEVCERTGVPWVVVGRGRDVYKRQVFYYKKTRKRIFLMAPLHHQFEKKGWSETKVVVRFWIVSGVLAACGFSLYFAQTLMAVA